MKKPVPRKLALQREVVRVLIRELELRDVRGGLEASGPACTESNCNELQAPALG